MLSNRQVIGPTDEADPSLNHHYDPRLDGAQDTLIDIGGERFFFAGAGTDRTFFGPFGKLGLMRQPDPAFARTEPGRGDDHISAAAITWPAPPASTGRTGRHSPRTARTAPAGAPMWLEPTKPA